VPEQTAPAEPKETWIQRLLSIHDGRGHLTVECRTLRQYLQDMFNERYLREFILNLGLPSEIRMQRQYETIDEHQGNSLIQYKEVDAIFGTSPVEGTTVKGRIIYVNEAQRDNSSAILTPPPSPLGRTIFFSKEDAYVMHFPYNDTLVVTIHIGCCKVLKILVDGGSSVNILYGHALDRIKDTFGLARKKIIPQI